MAARVSSRPVFRWLWLGGCGLLVFAARCREIHLYAGDIPFIDQWKAEGADILYPWLQGLLGPADFLGAHNGHVPLWSRLLMWIEVVLTGSWDPRVEMTVNAALHAGFVVVMLRWLWSGLTGAAALAASLLLLATAMLPFAWENITWGFQSQFPLALLGLVLHVTGTLTQAPYSRGWWWAQVAGLAALFTLSTLWTAPLAAGLVLLWTNAGRRQGWFVLGGLVATGVMLGLVASTATDGALFVQSLPVFLHAWFVQLGWPAETVLLNLPLVLLVFQSRGRRDTPAFDRVVLALGAWSVLQAAAIAYARSAEYIGFTSRYGDLLAIGLLANFVALLRLASARSLSRWAAVAGIAAWLGVAGHGLHAITTTGHTAYFHQHSAARNALRAEAVRAYVRDGNIAHLAAEQVREVLYPDPAEVARQLSLPALRDLLPALAGPSRTGIFVRELQSRWAFAGGLAGALMLAGLAGLHRPARAALPALEWRADPWRLRLTAGLGLGSCAGLFLWPRPWLFGEVDRKTAILQASGTIAPLRYEYQGAALFPPERMVGAARVAPGEVRNLFFGPVDMATIRSNSFHLITPRLIVPFAGNPIAPGVALQLVVEDSQGRVLHTYTCADPAGGEIGFWEIDVHENQKRSAYLVMTDQHSGAESWIAALPPQYAWKPGQAAMRAQAWTRERTAPAHDTLGLIGLLSLAGCAGIGWRRWKPPLG